MTVLLDDAENEEVHRLFSDERGVLIIAEIGKNFIDREEPESVVVYLEKAKRLVDAAKAAGADAVKLQTHDYRDEQPPGKDISPHFQERDRYAWVRFNTEMTPLDAFWRPLKAHCDAVGILFFTTPMSRGAARKVDDLVPFWKVGSGDILDFVLLDYLVSTRKRLILSTGMSTLEELDTTVAFLRSLDARFSLMHCVSEYPCPAEALNLATIPFLRKRYRVPVGFSDHSLSEEAAVLAVSLGAVMVEKHFTLSRNAWGADHKVSLTPSEFARLVANIRRQERDASQIERFDPAWRAAAIGEESKLLREGERVFRKHFRKSLRASRDIPAGTRLRAEDLYAMRGQREGWIPSERYEEVLGKRTLIALRQFDPLTATGTEPASGASQTIPQRI